MYIPKVYSIHYTLRWNTKVKKFPSDKINGTKNAIFFLSRTPAYRSFTFQILIWAEAGFPIFYCFPFIKVYIIGQQNALTYWL